MSWSQTLSFRAPVRLGGTPRCAQKGARLRSLQFHAEPVARMPHPCPCQQDTLKLVATRSIAVLALQLKQRNYFFSLISNRRAEISKTWRFPKECMNPLTIFRYVHMYILYTVYS